MKLSSPENKASEEKLKEALALSRSIGTGDLEAENLENLSELYRLQERWEEALKRHQEFHKITAEVFTQETTNQSQNFDHQRKMQNDERDRQVKLAHHQEQEKILHNVYMAMLVDIV
ncbi:MAG: hypothetical protein ACI9O4_000814 [Chitinophagales bacterium]|jgi:hypothetical protein